MTSEVQRKAIQLCEMYREKGYACAESVQRALADLYTLDVPDDVKRVISVFAGGGIDDGRCGIVESGNLFFALLKNKGVIDKNVDLLDLSRELHVAFNEDCGGYNCRDIFYPRYELHERSGKSEDEFKCAFLEGISIIVSIIERHKANEE